MNSDDQIKNVNPANTETSLILTSDGSHTLYVPAIDECYHSTHGAMQESQFIFIDCALKHCRKNEIRILEIGFGTGLNALLTYHEAQKSKLNIHYHTLEKYPLGLSKALMLNYRQVDNEIFEKLHRAGWDKSEKISDFFRLEKTTCDFTRYKLPYQYDVIFFDAFSPEKQAEMWQQSQFEKIFQACHPAALLTTYCAKGWVRRAMQAAGFTVERLPGPPGKREILRAQRP